MKTGRKHTVIFTILATLIIVYGGLIAGKVFSYLSSALFILLSESNTLYISQANMDVINENMSFLGIILLVCLFQWCIWKDSVKKIAFAKGWEKGYLQYGTGLLISIDMMTGLLLILQLTDTVKIVPSNTVNIAGIVFVFLSVMIQSFAEELVFRGFVFQKIKRVHGASWGIIVSSLLFALVHCLNAGNTVVSMVNIGLIGIVFGIITIQTGNILMACAIHAGWNFMNQIVFGFPNSGLITKEAIFPSVVKEKTIWFHNVNGAEGGLAATIVFFICFIIVIFLHKSSTSEKE